jgi:2-keto-3-deoxy-L-rhamnonate aldolase RhmA
MTDGFRQAVRSGRTLLGTFVKTASHQTIELVARTGLDFAIVDAEHAPFGAADLDRMALAGRATGLPLLVRAPDLGASFIGQALDMGFGGIVAPHIDSSSMAEQLLDASRFDRGQRGFSPSTRAGGYGAPDARAYRQAADRDTSLWCQIEDASALPNLDAIAAFEDIDCLFLGRADLSLSLGVDRQDDPKVVQAVQATAAAGRRHGRAVGIYIGAPHEIPELKAMGVTVFVCSSDQGWLIAEGRRLRRETDAILSA